nr:redoxin domain-containing protein [Pedobacter panaciterrae]
MKKIIFSLILCAFSTIAFSQTLLPGSTLPTAVFYKTDGNAYSTNEIAKGKKALLMFFDATCEHCQRTAANMSKRTKELANVNIYMITQDEQRSIDYFFTNYGKPLQALKNVTILQDRDRVFIPLFHPKQYPSLYLYDTAKKLTFYSSNEKDLPKFFDLMK